MTPAQVDELKQQIVDARTGHEWAFYNGTPPPAAVRRIAVLNALIALQH